MAQGVDLSGYQEGFDFAAAKAAGISFVYVKATEGTGYVSETLDAQRDGARAAGMLVGCYHFARPDRHTAQAEALYFAAHLDGQEDLPPALDFETSGGTAEWALTFLHTLEVATGRTPILYVNWAFWQAYFAGDARFDRYPLWWAQYGVHAPDGPRYDIWQYGDAVPLGGMGVDGNVADDDALARLARKPTPEPTPTPPADEEDTVPVFYPPTTGALHFITEVGGPSEYGHLWLVAGNPNDEPITVTVRTKSTDGSRELASLSEKVGPHGVHAFDLAAVAHDIPGLVEVGGEGGSGRVPTTVSLRGTP